MQNEDKTPSSYRAYNLMKLRPQKERQFKFWNMATSHENQQKEPEERFGPSYRKTKISASEAHGKEGLYSLGVYFVWGLCKVRTVGG